MLDLVIEPLRRRDGIFRVRVVDYTRNARTRGPSYPFGEPEGRVVFLSEELEILGEAVEQAKTWLRQNHPLESWRIEAEIEEIAVRDQQYRDSVPYKPSKVYRYPFTNRTRRDVSGD